VKINRLTLMISSVFILFVTAGFTFSGTLLAYNLKEYYPLGEGDTWVYKLVVNEGNVEIIDQEIAKIKGTEKIGKVETRKIMSLQSKNQCVAIDSEGVKLYKYWGWFNGDYETYEPPKMFFPNNMKVGESRTYKIISTIYDVRDIEDERIRDAGVLTITLASIEDVEVRAGKFKNCLKFVSVYDFEEKNEAEIGKETITTWLAPGIGRIKIEHNSVQYCQDARYCQNEKKEDKITESLELTEAMIKGKMVPPGSPPFKHAPAKIGHYPHYPQQINIKNKSSK